MYIVDKKRHLIVAEYNDENEAEFDLEIYQENSGDASRYAIWLSSEEKRFQRQVEMAEEVAAMAAEEARWAAEERILLKEVI